MTDDASLPWPRHRSPGYLAMEQVGKLVMLALTTHEWQGLDNVPTGPCLVASNHLSHADPITLGHALSSRGHVPRYMAKAELFDIPGLGAVLRNGGQIPVRRVAGKADLAYAAAVSALEQGELVVVYPEGTVTRDPRWWPMRGKTGVARLTLQTSVPVIPAGQWGVQHVWRPNSAAPRLGRRSPVKVSFGPPVDLDDLRAAPMTAETLREATTRIMDAITAQVAQLRGEAAPTTDRWDPRAHNQTETGRF